MLPPQSAVEEHRNPSSGCIRHIHHNPEPSIPELRDPFDKVSCPVFVVFYHIGHGHRPIGPFWLNVALLQHIAEMSATIHC
jgi:hypothetical protein